MGILKRFWARLRSVPRRNYVFGLAAVVVLLVVFWAGQYAWDYTNSSPFCGTTCHTMPPHYASYESSSHARVKCVECHIGRTSFGIEFTRKAVDAQFVVAYLTGNYKYPIYVQNLQPARETCEKCHWPEKFSNDKVVTLTDFQPDEKNTPTQTTLVMHTGGGTERQGLGYGIHWHIENPVNFYYTDDQQQNIPVIEVTNKDGTKTVYSDTENPLTPEQLAKLPKREMDCIDCHNRTSHNFVSPETALNTALQNKTIDAAIPQIKKKGVEVLTPLYKTTAEATQTIGNLNQFYQQTYPDYYNQNVETVQHAVKVLEDLYPTLHYPDQGLDWTTHPNNLGHMDAPGCFRCHDGKHFTADKKQAIRIECNLCHNLPVVSSPGQPGAAITLTKGDEPASHKTTTWLIEHRTKFDASCQQCHDTRNAGGKDNSSFCSNGACHGTKWTYAGFDAPSLAQIFKPPVQPQGSASASPPKIPHPIGGAPDCQICHGPKSIVRPYPVDHAGRTNDQCTACHTPSMPPDKVQPLVSGPPQVPHDLAGRNECLGCHGSGASGIPQIPQFHKDYQFPNTACLTCHKAAKQAAPAATPTTEAATTPTAAAPSATTAAQTSATPAAGTTAATAVATPAATTAAVGTATQAPGAGAPPALPADHAGRTVCLMCHSAGIGDAKKMPDDHAGRTDDLCLGCHKPQ